MPTLWLFDIEPHEQRYTSEWRQYLPQQIKGAMDAQPNWKWRLHVIEGIETSGTTSKGAFLNFAETSAYKSFQVASFSTQVEQKQVKKGDRLLFTDAWHPGVIQCRYMSDLLGLQLTIDVMWHAGSYDPWDFLGRKITNKEWSLAFERAVFEAADRSYFATEFHKRLFLDGVKPQHGSRAKVVGWPMEYLPDLLTGRTQGNRKDTILFPHRMTLEKQPEVLKELAPLLSTYRIFYAQEQALTKQQYHEELSRAAVVFSANKQETLGICPYEGLLCGAVPIVPDRLSYREMYHGRCYPSEWSEDLKSAKQYAVALVTHLNNMLEASSPKSLASLAASVGSQFFNGRKLYASILR